MTEEEAYKYLKDKSPTGYRLNELIPFSYPVRRIKLDILVNKQPDGSLVKVYNVLLRTIQAGFNTQQSLFDFLGLGQTDEFILRELFALREKGYLDLVNEIWIVTPNGQRFIEDARILRIEEEEEFEFLIDGISGDILSAKEIQTERVNLQKHLSAQVTLPVKDAMLLENKFQALADVYKQQRENKAYLISYAADEIKKDYEEWCNYWVIEYIPKKNNGQEARLEVRYFNSLKLDKNLTTKFNTEYRQYIYLLSNSDREAIAECADQTELLLEPEIIPPSLTSLTIWETKQKFIDALKNVKEKILIESPWIKRATLEYVPYFEKLLKEKKKLIILYGIKEKDEHDISTLNKVIDLQKEFKDNFLLIHLPSHLETFPSKMSGSHRKLVIKDNEYYLSGSFNFLSFAKTEGQQVANEESHLITTEVKQKWLKIEKEYGLKF